VNGQLRTVLMILYYFPPAASGGTYRPLKFIRYLPEFGWRSIVIAPFDNPYEAEDYSLLAEIPHGTEIHRVINYPESSWHFKLVRKMSLGFIYDRKMIPDRHVGFVNNAIEVGRKIIARGGIDLIFTSAPPYSIHIAGRELSREFQIPWVCDFRDPWVACPFYNPANSELDKKYREIEKSYFEQASRVISFPESRANIERARYRDYAQKIISIDNGYDPLDFSSPLPNPPEDIFRITHAGSITRDRPVTVFLEALRKVIDSNNQLEKKLRIEFIGDARQPTRADVQRLGLEAITDFRGYLPHRETCIEIASSNILFIVLPNLKGASEIMPLRLFEYIYSGRPVFLIAPKGGTSEFFEKAAAGVWVSHEDESEIVRKLSEFISDVHSNRYVHNPNLDVLRGYDRRTLTGRLAELFDSICKK